MKIVEKWLVEGVQMHDGMLRVDFDSRQDSKASQITHTEDGDDKLAMRVSDGRSFASKICETVTVTLEIDDGSPRPITWDEKRIGKLEAFVLEIAGNDAYGPDLRERARAAMVSR